MTLSTLKSLITAELDLPDLALLLDEPATTLKELRVDGPARVHLAMEIEDAFSICLPEDVVQGWECVAHVMESVSARTGIALAMVGEAANG